MRITIDIDVADLKQIQKITGQKKKSPAVSQALSQFLKLQERQKFLDRALGGQTDYAVSNEELEARDVYEAH
ncbi:MAG: type II toxin-antitoxin system VapB family antitoxin [Chloroflexi bacterium]|nr:type II toxin-antitoxin system VapB family antitoxin [Chloroflexota bacterium]